MQEESCFHGGAFWGGLDSQFRSSKGFAQIINADVLDAWFLPSPKVLRALEEFSPWVCQTSPPTYAEGLVKTIAETYSLPEEEILVGAGSSALWFLYASQRLDSTSNVLLVEPSYGEYAHVCDHVVRCKTDLFSTSFKNGFVFELEDWVHRICEGNYDLAVLVNPNNPTGTVFDRKSMMAALNQIPATTQILIDEAYMSFWNPEESLFLEPNLRPNVSVMCSFSKRFALSGLRVATLRCAPHLKSRLVSWTPPWAVSMPAQIAACVALGDSQYYKAKYSETHQLRSEMSQRFKKIGIEVHEGAANWINIRVSDAEAVCRECAQRKLFLRNLGKTAPSLGNSWVRIAVKDRLTNDRIVDTIREVLKVGHLSRAISV